MLYAVLIPCRNEEATVAKVVSDFRALLPHADIYVYDNDSTDRTAEVAAAAGAIVVPEYRHGKGFVVRSMFRDVEADVYLMVDGDDTYAAEDVVRLGELVASRRAGMAVGDRLSTTYLSLNTRPLHGAGNRVVTGLMNALFSSQLHDVMSGARAFSREFVKSYPLASTGFEIETHLTAHALDMGFAVAELPVAYRERPEGSVSKLRTVPDGMRVLSAILAVFRDYRPLALSGTIAALLLGSSFVLFIGPVEEYVLTHAVKKVPSLVVSGALGVSGLLALSSGVVLDAIRRQSRNLYELERSVAARRPVTWPPLGKTDDDPTG